jgi:HEAT repeat protein
MKKSLFISSLGCVALSVVLLCGANTGFAQTTANPWQLLPKYQFSQSREPLAAIQEQMRKASPAECKAMEDRLLAILKSSDATKDSRRFICQWLGVVGTEKSVAPLAALLSDPELAHPARIGLERLPYPSAGKALTDALSSLKGDLLVGAVSSIGVKRVTAAVPALSTLLKSGEDSVVQAALFALGEIGDDSASKALASAAVSVGMARDLARARVSAAARLAQTGKRSEAAAVYRGLMSEAGQSTAIRVASFLGLVGTLPTKEAQVLITQALEGDDELMRTSAVKAFANAGKAREAVATQLPRMQPRGQLLLLGILVDAREVPARKPLLQVLESTTKPEVKAAALECLGTHGQAEDVALVAKAAATGEASTKAAARKTLQRISGRGVDAALIRVVQTGDIAERKAVLEALPSRRMEAALPTIADLMRGSDTVLAAEAAKAVGKMGGAAQIKDLAQVMTSTQSEDVRTAAQEAIKTICTKVEDKSAAATVIQGELEHAKSPKAHAALLPLTMYIGGETALNQVLEGMRNQEAEVRDVAFRTLVSWPEARAAAPLLQFAETNATSSQAIVALRDGCLRLAEMEEVPATERGAILRRVVQVARRPEEKRRAMALMSQVPTLELLEFVTRLTANASLRDDAVASTIQLARNLGAVYPRQSMAALEEMKKLAQTPEQRTAVENGMKAVRNAGQSPEGYIIGWLLSGPYTEPDKDGSALFNIAFPPEKGDGNAEWRPVTAPLNGIIDLQKLMSGDNRVAYLRTILTSEQEQQAVLELGSDDGVKVWVNGKLAHSNNASRPCSPGEDKASVTLKQGENVLLLKITQGGGGWAAVARLRDAAGKPLSNVIIGASKD